MIDNEEIGLNCKSSFIYNVLGFDSDEKNKELIDLLLERNSSIIKEKLHSKSHYFLPKELVYDYVSRLMKSNKDFSEGIEINNKRNNQLKVDRS